MRHVSSPAEVLAALSAQGAQVVRLVSDSRQVRPGDTFVACRGTTQDARHFIPQAITAGAAAVIWDAGGSAPGLARESGSKETADFAWDPAWRVPNVAVPGLRSMVGPLASELLGAPSRSLWIAGVTGTNGKTSVSQWVAQALRARGERAGVVGTLGIGLVGPAGPELTANPNTTPDPIVIQEALAAFRDAGATVAAMEVSSIGLDQDRVNGVRFDCAILTNLTRDHLDYHGTMERYAEAKAKLFDTPSLSHAVLNLDDALGVRIAASLKRRGVERVGYSASGTAARIDCERLLLARRVEYRPEGLRFALVEGKTEHPVATRLVGSFNVANLLAVCGALVARGLDLTEAVAYASALAPVPGRMERVGGGGQPWVIIDYAHTPDALEKVLQSARELANAGDGRLIAVFGCGGDRDRGKRPLMGSVAGRLADHVIVTSDNPRSEDPGFIADQIAEGLAGQAAEWDTVLDRRTAIIAAARLARPGDVIVLAGKGHESYQEIQGVRTVFSDRAEARAALDATATLPTLERS